MSYSTRYGHFIIVIWPETNTKHRENVYYLTTKSLHQVLNNVHHNLKPSTLQHAVYFKVDKDISRLLDHLLENLLYSMT